MLNLPPIRGGGKLFLTFFSSSSFFSPFIREAHLPRVEKEAR